jgi:hypothetical protein
MMHFSVPAIAVQAAPAGGAALGDIIIATVGAAVLTLAVFALGWGHRTGRIGSLRRLADYASRVGGLPAWAALPSAVGTPSLLCALFGMYWDISLHIDNGRDPGPLANPAHYFILAGLFGLFVAGFLAVVLAEGRPGRASVRLYGSWYAPVGGVVLLACSSFALLAFPMDDVWHRFFGQDVTLWGPTHLMMIGGAGLSLLGIAALVVEGGAQATQGIRRAPVIELLWRLRYGMAVGGLLIGLSTFQGEFDFGVPQFRMLFEPVLIAIAASVGLVAARIYGGRGTALFAAGFFIAVRGIVSILVGPVLGEVTPHFPLYLVEAGIVEAVALRIAPRERSYAFGAVSGVGIATIGFAAEYAWSHVWMPVPWPAILIGEAAFAVPVAAIAGGLIGGFVGSALASPREGRTLAGGHAAPAVAGLAAIVAIFAYGLHTSPEQGVRGTVTLTNATRAPDRTVDADIRISPPSATSDADWLNALAWQGGGLVRDDLVKVGPGHYRTSEPLPVHGDWKALVRISRGDSLIAIPVYLPNDPAIPAPKVPARSRFTRTFIPDHQILQREQKSDVPAALPLIGYGSVGAITLALVLLLGWALRRLARSTDEDGRGRAAPAAARPRLSVPATGGAR